MAWFWGWVMQSWCQRRRRQEPIWEFSSSNSSSRGTCLAICFDFYHQIKSWNVFNQALAQAVSTSVLFFTTKLLFVLRMVLYYPHSQVSSWIFHSLPFSLQANSPSDQCSNALMKNSWAASQEYIIYQISVSWPGRAARANPDYPRT